MDAVTLVNQHIDVKKLLEHYDFDQIHSDGEIIRSCCKLHGGNNPTAFAINRESGLWFCHTGSCGGGDLYTLVEKMEGIDFKSAVQWLADFFDVDITNLRVVERKKDYMDELKKFIKAMKSRKSTDLRTFTIPEEIKLVTKYRNFKLETLQHFALGYVESVKLKTRDGKEYVLKDRLVFPIWFNHVQVGISFRRIHNQDYPKWSHQPANLEAGEIIYNYDAVDGQNSIVVCEGISDVWAFHEIGVVAVAMFGSHITETQYKLLLKTGADLILAFDGDDAGRNATEKAQQLFRYKANLYKIQLNEGEDPENISREELKKRYDNRSRL